MKYIVSALLLLASLTACHQEKECKFPRIGAEDTEKIMSDKYWSYWTPEVQARIDAGETDLRLAEAVPMLPSLFYPRIPGSLWGGAYFRYIPEAYSKAYPYWA